MGLGPLAARGIGFRLWLGNEDLASHSGAKKKNRRKPYPRIVAASKYFKHYLSSRLIHCTGEADLTSKALTGLGGEEGRSAELFHNGSGSFEN